MGRNVIARLDFSHVAWADVSIDAKHLVRFNRYTYLFIYFNLSLYQSHIIYLFILTYIYQSHIYFNMSIYQSHSIYLFIFTYLCIYINQHTVQTYQHTHSFVLDSAHTLRCKLHVNMIHGRLKVDR